MQAQLLTSGLQGSFGSTVGPGGDLYVAEGVARRVSRVNPETGTRTTFASGLPAQVIPGVGAATDVAFVDGTGYVLVQFIGPFLGGPDEVNGIYRIDGPHTFTVVADIGAFNVANPPDTDFEAPIGVQTSFQAFQGGFLVTDGHLNRMLRVTLDGDISVIRAFDNIVPVGLETWGNTIYMAEAGPSLTFPRTARSCRSPRSRRPSPRSPQVVPSWSTWSGEEGQRCTAWPRGPGHPALSPEIRHCRTPVNCCGSTRTAPSPSWPVA